MKKLSRLSVVVLVAAACGGADTKSTGDRCADCEPDAGSGNGMMSDPNGAEETEASAEASPAESTDSSPQTDAPATPSPASPEPTLPSGTPDGSAGPDLPAPDGGASTDDDPADEPGTDQDSTDPPTADGTDQLGSDETGIVETEGEATDEEVTEQGTDQVQETDEALLDGGVIAEPVEGAPEFDGQPEKVDVLLVVDNSISMADKQTLLSTALPDLVERLVSPNCRNSEGDLQPPNGAGECPEGWALEFPPIADLHLGIITTSLGGSGSFANCRASSAEHSEQQEDMGHLLGSLERGAAAVPSAAVSGFLSWAYGDASEPLIEDFADLVVTAGEFGCGWEATLESWVHFLVDPFPYTEVTRQACNDSDANDLCAGPAVDAEGNQLVDGTILAQRAEFLRPDSLLAVVMFSDESDCSFKASGQSWRWAQTVNEEGSFNPAFKATGACDDPAMGANHECCTSCGVARVAPGCPSTIDEMGAVVAVGCEDGSRYGVSGLEDPPNLRCFQQKRRFGIDSLYPVERYSNALSLEVICPTNDDLSPDGCDVPLQRNPIFGLQGGLRRPDNWVFLAGILGVPWQDIAVDPSGAEPLRYRSNAVGSATPINWEWILGEVDPSTGSPLPDDPLMQESVEPRTGVNPATGTALAPTDAGYLQNPINGHEWNIADASDLQYACIFPINPRECPTLEEYYDLVDVGAAVPACDCTDFGGDVYQNPTCQAPNGSYGLTQSFGKAYPGLRQLQVLKAFGENSVVASICPKTLSPAASDYGYRPAVNALLERFRGALSSP